MSTKISKVASQKTLFLISCMYTRLWKRIVTVSHAKISYALLDTWLNGFSCQHMIVGNCLSFYIRFRRQIILYPQTTIVIIHFRSYNHISNWLYLFYGDISTTFIYVPYFIMYSFKYILHIQFLLYSSIHKLNAFYWKKKEGLLK